MNFNREREISERGRSLAIALFAIAAEVGDVFRRSWPAEELRTIPS